MKPKRETASNTANAVMSDSEEEVVFYFIDEDEEEGSLSGWDTEELS